MDKAQLRSKIFKHIDGLAMIPVANSLKKNNLLSYIVKNKSSKLSELTRKFNTNEGYLNVALRVLCSQGVLSQTIADDSSDVTYTITDKGLIAIPLFDFYSELTPLLNYSTKKAPYIFEEAHFNLLTKLFKRYENKFGLELSENPEELAIQENILIHAEGILAGPLLVHLGMKGMFHKYFMEKSFRPEEFHPKPDGFRKILDFFTHLGWFDEKKGNYQFTEEGLFFAKRASAYGVTTSYFPTFNNINELIFGNPRVLEQKEGETIEKHVDREMNVWGSGGAHSNYFKVIDDVVMDIFNRPIEEQPKGILDMGCGNGAFLIHLFDLIEQKTLRGKVLDEHPLFLVGVDYNEAALKVTRANLIQADIWAKVIWGDIGRPDLLAKDLKENYSIDLSNLLNVRTFLDHNRIWEEPKNTEIKRTTKNSGAYAYKGERIPNPLVEQNLFEHLQKWKPYVEKFGLLMIELHTIKPELAAQNIGKTPVTAYDATHGFSDQYIVEIEEFIKVCKEVGLNPDPNVNKRYPNADIATVTINLFRN